MSYRISFTSGSLISSFCLSIKGRHDTPSLSFCSDGNKSDLALYVYEILLFLSAPYGGRLLNLTVGLLTLPAAACECQKLTSVHHRSLRFHLREILFIIFCLPFVYAILSSAYLLSSSSFNFAYCKATFSLALRESLK